MSIGFVVRRSQEGLIRVGYKFFEIKVYLAPNFMLLIMLIWEFGIKINNVGINNARLVMQGLVMLD